MELKLSVFIQPKNQSTHPVYDRFYYVEKQEARTKSRRQEGRCTNFLLLLQVPLLFREAVRRTSSYRSRLSDRNNERTDRVLADHEYTVTHTVPNWPERAMTIQNERTRMLLFWYYWIQDWHLSPNSFCYDAHKALFSRL